MNWSDEELSVALRELRDEELPAAALAEVRLRVCLQARPRRAKWWYWVWVPALAAVLAVVAVMPRQQPAVQPPPLLARAPAVQPINHPAPPTQRPAKPAAAVTETQFARILTDDPNVVILWAMTTEGDSR